MQLQPIKPARVSDHIAEQIKALIRTGALRPGDKLPAERELMQQLKVSRASVREALLKLEANGLIYSRQGGGTFVADELTPTITNPLAHLIHDNPDALSDVMECRHGLEVLAASHAAVRASPTVQQVIKERFADLEAAHAREDLELEAKADADFHMAIAEASNNVALIHLTRSLFDLLGDQVIHNWEQIYRQKESREAIHQQHREILDAILARDAEAARNAAQRHLAFVGRCLREGREATASLPARP
ncbi:MAG: FCD domain-containing protein [Gammaproteobacteria bacterium]